MDAIEKAVRNALEKGDAGDTNFRRRVYVSARSALEKSMSGRKLAQSTVDERFSRLAEIAAMIESEFQPAAGAFEYQAPGRRVYEAPAPLVEEGLRLSETDEARESVSVPDVEAGGDPGEHAVRADAPAEVNPGAGAVEEPQPHSETAGGEITPVRVRKPRKSTAKKAAKPEMAAEPLAVDAESPAPDLFGEPQPVWDEVSIGNEEGSETAPGGSPAGVADELALPEAGPVGEISDGESAEEHDLLLADLPEERDESEESGRADLERLDGAPSGFVTDEASAALPVGAEFEHDGPEPAASLFNDPVATHARLEVRPLEDIADKPPEPNVVAQRAAGASGEPRRGWAFLFILCTLLAFFVMGLWIAYSTGALKIRGMAQTGSDTAVRVDPQDAPAEPVAPAAETATVPDAPPDEWLMIFNPDNPGELVVEPTIRAEVSGQGPLAHLRIESASDTKGEAAVVFSIGQGILEQIAGKNVVFDIVAAADDGAPTQMSIVCDFAGLGDCGRKRYQVDAATSDNLFQIEFPAGAPQGSGRIVLNPDVDGKGRALEIYAIKVRVAN